MRKFKYVIFLAALAATNLAWAEVPVDDVYADKAQVNSTPIDNGEQASAAQTSGLDDSAAPVTSVKSGMPLEQRVIILERQTNNLAQLLTQANSLQQQIQELRGQVEMQNHTIQVLQDQVRSQYKDIDQRLTTPTADTSKKSAKAAKPAITPVADTTPAAPVKAKVPSDPKITATPKDFTESSDDVTDDKANATSEDSATARLTSAQAEVVSPRRSGNNADDTAAYQAAFALLKTKKYNPAANAFQSFIKQYPASKNLVNARYWLGQLYLLQGQPDKAIRQFTTIVKDKPNDTKVPDARLQLGLAYYAQGDLTHAKSELTKVQQKYPDSSAAKLAKTRLEQIVQASPSSSDG